MSAVATEPSTSHTIDCDVDPFAPGGLRVVEHQKGGTFIWDKEAQKGALYLSKRQAGTKHAEGYELLKELTDKSIPVLNANVLEYLLANPHLIPEEWKGKYVFFWGTVYHVGQNVPCVCCLYWDDNGWDWDRRCLTTIFGDNNPAAVRAE